MSVGQSLKIAVAAGIAWGACASAQAALYVYELPNGARVITDQIIIDRSYKLIRLGKDAKGIGRAAVKLHTPYFDPTAYDKLIERAAAEHKIEFALVKAVVHAESSFNRYAKSHKGAIGLMQLMPGTARMYGIEQAEDVYDPALNVSAGAQHLKYLLQKFKDKRTLALAAYNAGEGAVFKYKGIPPFPETQEYVKKVMQFHKQYSSPVTRSVHHQLAQNAS